MYHHLVESEDKDINSMMITTKRFEVKFNEVVAKGRIVFKIDDVWFVDGKERYTELIITKK